MRFRARVQSAAKGLKARVSASPHIWDEHGDSTQDEDTTLDDVSDWLELPADFKAPDHDDADYRRLSRFDLDRADFEPDEAKWSLYESE
jgi:hypothetical protein